MANDRPDWDAAFAERLLGATILVGLTRTEAGGDSLEQFYGTVVSVDLDLGITLSLEGSRAGETFNLPPDTRPFTPAPSGSYRLRQTGEVVVDPDYTAKWRMSGPSQ